MPPGARTRDLRGSQVRISCPVSKETHIVSSILIGVSFFCDMSCVKNCDALLSRNVMLCRLKGEERESVLLIGTQFSNLSTAVDTERKVKRE